MCTLPELLVLLLDRLFGLALCHLHAEPPERTLQLWMAAFCGLTSARPSAQHQHPVHLVEKVALNDGRSSVAGWPGLSSQTVHPHLLGSRQESIAITSRPVLEQAPSLGWQQAPPRNGLPVCTAVQACAGVTQP